MGFIIHIPWMLLAYAQTTNIENNLLKVEVTYKIIDSNTSTTIDINCLIVVHNWLTSMACANIDSI